MNPDEIIAVVDDNDNVIGEAARKEVNKGLLHREVYIYLINSKKQVLLHKRADNHLWDHSSSGHLPTEQDYEEGAIRETEEELGIKLDKEELKELAKEKFKTVKPEKINYRFAKVYLVKKDVPIEEFKIQEEEVEAIKYFDESELKELMDTPEKIMTGSAKKVIKKYILKLL